MDVRFPNSALRFAAEAAANAARTQQASARIQHAAQAIASPQPVLEPKQGFAAVMSSALNEVSAAQNASTTLQKDFQVGAPHATLESTMLAMQKGQIAFQAAVTVRNRLVSAYTDIMNMNV